MKEAKEVFQTMLASVPPEIRLEIDLCFNISDRINELMHEKGLTKKTICRRFREKTK